MLPICKCCQYQLSIPMEDGKEFGVSWSFELEWENGILSFPFSNS